MPNLQTCYIMVTCRRINLNTSYIPLHKHNIDHIWLAVLSDQLFEGCLLLDDKDRELLSQPSDSRTEDKKTHITTKEKVWPSNEIPYDSTFNGVREENKGIHILSSMTELFTCIFLLVQGGGSLTTGLPTERVPPYSTC